MFLLLLFLLLVLFLLLPLLLLQPPAKSYSFRNADVRFFGGVNEPEEKEDNSESDEEQSEVQNKCLSSLKEFCCAVFPNTYPFFWLLLPFVVCGVLAAASYGDQSDTSQEGLLVFSTENHFHHTNSTTPESQTVFVSDSRLCTNSNC